MSTIRLTAAQALVRFLSAQMNENRERFVAGVWAIFGHGNVAGLGEALYRAGDALPTWRGHNEQGMGHAAIAYAKASNRKRAMAVTSSIGPGATNMVTAAAVAHVNRLPVLFLPGDVFASRLPDPVLQQVEDFSDGTVSANDCFRPVSRYFDRIARPEQLLTALAARHGDAHRTRAGAGRLPWPCARTSRPRPVRLPRSRSSGLGHLGHAPAAARRRRAGPRRRGPARPRKRR